MLLPPGACLIHDYITFEEERVLLTKLDHEVWYEALNRKVIHFGSQYRYFASEPKRHVQKQMLKTARQRFIFLIQHP
jgi:hypothetical protein